MRAYVPLTALAVILTLSACSKKAEETDAPAGAETASETLEASATPTTLPPETGPESEPTSTASPTPTASEPAEVATAIPSALRGRWGLVPKDCTSQLGDAKGLLTVSASQLKFYESVAKLGKVQSAGDDRLRASFRYSGEGMTWTQDVVLEAQDGGKTLVRRDYGPDAQPGPLKYTRCS